jgi:hypothetical protein
MVVERREGGRLVAEFTDPVRELKPALKWG